MSSSTTYDPLDADIPNRVLGFIPHLDVPTHAPNTLVNADVLQVYDSNIDVDLVPRIYWLAVPDNNQVIQMSSLQIALVDSKAAAALLLSEKESAKTILEGPQDLGKLLRASDDQILIQLNLHSNWEAATSLAVAAATSLSDLKTRWAAISPVPTITLAQAKSAIRSDIDSGNEGN